jgi:hypothetical protein
MSFLLNYSLISVAILRAEEPRKLMFLFFLFSGVVDLAGPASRLSRSEKLRKLRLTIRDVVHKTSYEK